MVFFEPVFEAVVAVAGGAVDAGHEGGADGGFAGGRGAGLLRDEVAHGLVGAEGRAGEVRLALALRPGAGVGAFVGGFGAVVEAEGVVAGLAVEGEEVELVAVGELAVRAEEGGVGVAYLGGHGGVACVVWVGGGGAVVGGFGGHGEGLFGVGWWMGVYK